MFYFKESVKLGVLFFFVLNQSKLSITKRNKLSILLSPQLIKTNHTNTKIRPLRWHLSRLPLQQTSVINMSYINIISMGPRVGPGPQIGGNFATCVQLTIKWRAFNVFHMTLKIDLTSDWQFTESSKINSIWSVMKRSLNQSCLVFPFRKNLSTWFWHFQKFWLVLWLWVEFLNLWFRFWQFLQIQNSVGLVPELSLISCTCHTFDKVEIFYTYTEVLQQVKVEIYESIKLY